MRFITLSVPPPFADGPQYDEDGNLIPGSWPSGLPHEGIQAWVKVGIPADGRELIDCLVPDDWPIGDIPAGWLNDGNMQWDFIRRDEYDEQGNLVNAAIDTRTPTNYAEYNKHLEDPTTARVHVILGWPEIRD